ncbi:hypothetical protein BDY21DRAFT_6112 [Lineolata rhizophorae]|uniref:Uncharacterized protein n=1 Tax=Lineolata rhizophorae TaxID=578093 RepID=A0A6A6PF85_9PEZI|nr:hypothetical protein BDY21DRAFT_6112 [Lineolata rhizophorae]
MPSVPGPPGPACGVFHGLLQAAPAAQRLAASTESTAFVFFFHGEKIVERGAATRTRHSLPAQCHNSVGLEVSLVHRQKVHEQPSGLEAVTSRRRVLGSPFRSAPNGRPPALALGGAHMHIHTRLGRSAAHAVRARPSRASDLDVSSLESRARTHTHETYIHPTPTLPSGPDHLLSAPFTRAGPFSSSSNVFARLGREREREREKGAPWESERPRSNLACSSVPRTLARFFPGARAHTHGPGPAHASQRARARQGEAGKATRRARPTRRLQSPFFCPPRLRSAPTHRFARNSAIWKGPGADGTGGPGQSR